MPWERNWLRINTSGFPPGHPLYRDEGQWRDFYWDGPDDHPKEMKEASAIADALRHASDPDEVAALLERAHRLRAMVHWASIPSQSVQPAWRRLLEKNALDPPTHDILELEVSGKNTRLRFAELSRREAWRAPDAGRFCERTVDLWVTPDGAVWPPYLPQQNDGGGAWAFTRDVKGRVYEPKPLWLAVGAGSQLQTRRVGMYYERRIELLDAVVLRGPGQTRGPTSVAGGLAEAALAVLTRS